MHMLKRMDGPATTCCVRQSKANAGGVSKVSGSVCRDSVGLCHSSAHSVHARVLCTRLSEVG